MFDILNRLMHFNRIFDLHHELGLPSWMIYSAFLLVILVFFVLFAYKDPPLPTSHSSLDQLSSERVRTQVNFQRIHTNGIRLHTLTAGDPSRPLVILLHGFPELWKAWEHYIDDLVNAGFYVMIPDQRGYNLSDKPTNFSDYKMTRLADDIIGLIDHARKEKAYLGGHDWGGVVSWYLVTHKPERFHKAVILNAPHISAAIKVMKRDPDQKKRLGYMKFFQLPFLPQWSMAKNNFQQLEEILLKTANPGAFSSEDIRAYKKAWNDRGTLNCLLMWYRAALFRPTFYQKDKVRTKVPVKVIWGVKDHVLKKELGEESVKYCENGTLELVEDATHWILHEQPRIVSRSIVDYFRA